MRFYRKKQMPYLKHSGRSLTLFYSHDILSGILTNVACMINKDKLEISVEGTSSHVLPRKQAPTVQSPQVHPFEFLRKEKGGYMSCI